MDDSASRISNHSKDKKTVTRRRSWNMSLFLASCVGTMVTLSCLGSTRSTRALMQEMKSGLTELVTAIGVQNDSSSDEALDHLSSEMSATTEFRPISRFSDSFLAVPSQNNHKQEVTVVVQLSGELGNQMHKIANGICVKNQIEKVSV
jgi:hypothetical protein